MGKINLNPEWVTHATMARFLRMRQDVLYQKVLSGEVPAKTLGDGQIRVESRTDVYYPYLYNKKLVLSCLGYKPRTRDKDGKEVRDPLVFGYARASHRYNSREDSDCIPAQVDRCKAFAESSLPGLKYGGCIVDRRKSAYKIRFFRRAGGQELRKKLCRGDHLIIDKVDRIWRDVYDFSEVMQVLQREGVIVHFENLGGRAIDMSNPAEAYMMTVFVAGAQFQSGMTSERGKAHKARMREQGRWLGNPTKLMGRMKKYVGRIAYCVWDPYERWLMGEVVRLHDEQGQTIEQIRVAVGQLAAQIKVQDPSAKLERDYQNLIRQFVVRMYVYEKNIRLLNVTDPAMFAPEKLKQAHQWKNYHNVRHISTPHVPGAVNEVQSGNGHANQGVPA